MSVEYFLDTNILLYAASASTEPAERTKHERCWALVAPKTFGTSGQVLQEFYANATKKAKHAMSASGASAWLMELDVIPCVPIDRALVRAGIAFSIRYKISYWDGAILAAAEALGTDRVYTEDLNHGQKYGNVTVINPFK